ncbi:MAG: ATP-binding protein [Ignavibacteria bacterium]|nr:ATP-binding protein [Ignavibacteria bacterium]
MIRHLKYVLKTSPFEIDALGSYLKEALQGHTITEDHFNSLLLALTEALNNAIIHGNKSDIRKSILLEFIVSDDSIKTVITDEGEGFNPESVPDPTLPENLLKDHGRGLFIMQHFVDEIYFDKTDKGNSVYLVSYFNKKKES